MAYGIGFEGRAAIVTGAAGGIGRALALELARRGASVLVNDAGGTVAGSGASSAPAEAVAEEIRRAGGTAVADATAIGSAQAARGIVEAAQRAFGRVDVLANVAGTALPGEITAFDDEQVEAQFRTNLLGPYLLVRAVWPVMRAQRYGRILNTSSNAALGIGANAPYATTRAGLLGLTLDAALEGREHGILVNAILPSAYSRMIEQIPDARFVDWFRRHLPPEKVAAVAAYLLCERCTLHGRMLAVGGGRVARIAFVEGTGWFDRDITSESIAAQIERATDMSGARILDFQEDAMRLLCETLAPLGATPILDRSAVVGAGRIAARAPG